MKKEKREPMTHLLTPRYKGMSAFVTHAPDNVCSCTMSFVTDHGEVNASTGKIEGGVKCSKGLTDPGRIIPDLHSVFKGGLKCFVKIHTLELHSDAKLVEQGQELDEAGAKKIRQQLIEDQVTKDEWMRVFDETGKYPGIATGRDWDLFPTLHVRMNAILAAHTWLTMAFGSWVFGVSHGCFALWMGYAVLATFALHGVSHKVGQWTSDGRSRESLVGETAIKAFLSVAFGRSMNQGGKKEEPAKETKKGK